jgi:uncharacterized protein
MQHQISVITLGIADMALSRRFYTEGFGWKPVFENDEIIFYQMNGLVLGTWTRTAQAADMARANRAGPADFALAHNVPTRADVQPAIDQLILAGGKLLKAPIDQPYGGHSGYIADPDDHAWEIAWNPAWAINADGHVTFGL